VPGQALKQLNSWGIRHLEKSKPAHVLRLEEAGWLYARVLDYEKLTNFFLRCQGRRQEEEGKITSSFV
jgi:hypothetical protein